MLCKERETGSRKRTAVMGDYLPWEEVITQYGFRTTAAKGLKLDEKC